MLLSDSSQKDPIPTTDVSPSLRQLILTAMIRSLIDSFDRLVYFHNSPKKFSSNSLNLRIANS